VATRGWVATEWHARILRVGGLDSHGLGHVLATDDADLACDTRSGYSMHASGEQKQADVQGFERELHGDVLDRRAKCTVIRKMNEGRLAEVDALVGKKRYKDRKEALWALIRKREQGRGTGPQTRRRRNKGCRIVASLNGYRKEARHLAALPHQSKHHIHQHRLLDDQNCP
jgi:hypothetical protein